MPSNCGAGEDSWKSLGQHWVNLKGAQPWTFTRRTDAEAEAPVFWSSDGNRGLVGKAPDAGKIDGRKRRECQRMRWLDSITDEMNMNLGKLWEMVKDRDAWRAAVRGVTKSSTWLGDWTTTWIICISNILRKERQWVDFQSYFEVALFQQLLCIIKKEYHYLTFTKSCHQFIYLSHFFQIGCCAVTFTLNSLFFTFLSHSLTFHKIIEFLSKKTS